MNRTAYVLSVFLTAVAATFPFPAAADTFGSGANSFDIEFVTIGDPGNPPDTTDRPVTDGAVPYVYRIGKYEVPEQMIDAANALGGLGITKDTRGPDFPATSISWFEAAKFVNWLNESTGSPPAYKFDATSDFQLWLPTDPGYNANNLFRNNLARYFLPTLDEWHKAAYYDPVAGVYYDYPTGSDDVPDGIDFPGDTVFDAVFNDGGDNLGPHEITNVGVLSPYGTAGQGGNVFEWEETSFDRLNNSANAQRGLRGGGWTSTFSVLAASNRGIGTPPLLETEHGGFRIVHIPEPSSGFIAFICGLVCLGASRHARRSHNHLRFANQCDAPSPYFNN